MASSSFMIIALTFIPCATRFRSQLVHTSAAACASYRSRFDLILFGISFISCSSFTPSACVDSASALHLASTSVCISRASPATPQQGLRLALRCAARLRSVCLGSVSCSHRLQRHPHAWVQLNGSVRFPFHASRLVSWFSLNITSGFSFVFFGTTFNPAIC